MKQIIDKTLRFWRTYGSRALIWRLRGELSKRMGRHAAPVLGDTTEAMALLPGSDSRRTARELHMQRFPALTALPCFKVPLSQRKRVNLVTDSINAGSLFGGVGTALIFATLLANRLDADLRIITRTEVAQVANLDHVLSVYGLALKGESQFVFLPLHEDRHSIDFCETDLFVTTSWWTTAATLKSIPEKLVVYLLQEDERMFYPYGDDRCKCEDVLSNTGIMFLINTQLLFDHLLNSGLHHLRQNGSWFEPSFSPSVFYPRIRVSGEKKKLIFYARPHNLRNLFYLGIEVLDAAIASNVIDLQDWDIIFVGKAIPNIVLEGGYAPTMLENLNWAEYAELVGGVDLGLCLMYTPHPSYPPLDLVASGAIAVTNSFANKQDLSHYSANLICVSPNKASLLDALCTGVALAKNQPTREKNFLANGLGKDWSQSFGDAIERLAARF